jgi:hypothetical protein
MIQKTGQNFEHFPQMEEKFSINPSVDFATFKRLELLSSLVLYKWNADSTCSCKSDLTKHQYALTCWVKNS